MRTVKKLIARALAFLALFASPSREEESEPLGPEAREDLEDLERELYETWCNGMSPPSWENQQPCTRERWGRVAACARRWAKHAPLEEHVALKLLDQARELASSTCLQPAERLEAIRVGSALLEAMPSR